MGIVVRGLREPWCNPIYAHPQGSSSHHAHPPTHTRTHTHSRPPITVPKPSSPVTPDGSVASRPIVSYPNPNVGEYDENLVQQYGDQLVTLPDETLGEVYALFTQVRMEIQKRVLLVGNLVAILLCTRFSVMLCARVHVSFRFIRHP